MNRLILQLKKLAALYLTGLTLGCLTLSPQMQAAVNTPDPGSVSPTNTADGESALLGATGFYNSAFGFLSLLSNGSASFNTGVGAGTLLSNTGDSNTATGAAALFSNTSGDSNTANGAFALFTNNTGNNNTANGYQALFSNTTGGDNTAIGLAALFGNTTGASNTATGWHALLDNTTGSQNTATGSSALALNTTGDSNTATGLNALASNTTGSENTATGLSALAFNTTGSDNTATGLSALANNTTGIKNTAIGQSALVGNTTGSSNIAVGQLAGSNLTTGGDNIDIGNEGVADESSTIRIGAAAQTATFIAGISGTAVTGNAVVVDANGQLGTAPSSARFKKDIKPMDKTSEAILGLKPVSFHYKSDSKETAQFGLIAEEVAKVNPDLVVHDRNGEIYSVRYEAVNAMLLNEFLKEHQHVQEQDATIARQQKQIEALSAGLQEVSAQLEMTKLAPQTALNNH